MHLIGLVGKKHHGKDSWFKYLRSHLPGLIVYRYAFADPVKRECLRALRVSGFNGDLEYLELHKELFRGLFQWWGTEFRRNLFGEDYWLRRLEETLTGSPASVAVVTDVRFQNEAELIRRRGGVLIRLIRMDLEESDAHLSETEQDLIEVDHVWQVRSLAQLADTAAAYAERILQLNLHK